MEGITQGTLGAAAAQAVFGKKLPRSAWLIGVVGGLVADMDVLFRQYFADGDPLGGLTLHRGFTHSLMFIPVGALLAALPFLFLPTYRGKRWAVYGAAFVAMATHAPLDACTNYGTLLFWPFSNERVAWDNLSFIDPFFSVPILLLLLVSIIRGGATGARLAMLYAFLYAGLGFYQHHRAMDVQAELAALRGQTVERGRTSPMVFSNQLWRSVYIADDRVHVDTIRLPLFAEPTVDVGNSAEHVDQSDLKADGMTDPVMLEAFERFSWFADGFTGWIDDPRKTSPDGSGNGGDAATSSGSTSGGATASDRRAPVIGDMRFCIDGDTLQCLWGFYAGELSQPVGRRFIFLGGRDPFRTERLWIAIRGEDPSFQTLATLKPGAE